MAPKKSSTPSAKPATPTAADFSVGDVVLTKIKGYPDWPSKVRGRDAASVQHADVQCVQVMDHESAPAGVLKQKQNRSLLVRFFPDGD